MNKYDVLKSKEQLLEEREEKKADYKKKVRALKLRKLNQDHDEMKKK